MSSGFGSLGLNKFTVMVPLAVYTQLQEEDYVKVFSLEVTQHMPKTSRPIKRVGVGEAIKTA